MSEIVDVGEVYSLLDRNLNHKTGRPTIKIGFSGQEDDNRKGQVNTGNSAELIKINSLDVPIHLMKLEEDLAHNYFSDNHVRGEWFDITEEQVEEYFSERRKEYQEYQSPIDGTKSIVKSYKNKIRKAYPCYFYPEQQAQDTKGPKSKEVIRGIKDTTRYRKMEWPNVDESHPSFACRNKKGVSQVYISAKKHEENLEELDYEKNKKSEADLVAFFV